jgi:hypothetical protein
MTSRESLDGMRQSRDGLRFPIRRPCRALLAVSHDAAALLSVVARVAHHSFFLPSPSSNMDPRQQSYHDRPSSSYSGVPGDRDRRDSAATLYGRGGYNQASYASAGRAEPLKGDPEADGALDDGFDIYADFNNAGPKYASVSYSGGGGGGGGHECVSLRVWHTHAYRRPAGTSPSARPVERSTTTRRSRAPARAASSS